MFKDGNTTFRSDDKQLGKALIEMLVDFGGSAAQILSEIMAKVEGGVNQIEVQLRPDSDLDSLRSVAEVADLTFVVLRHQDDRVVVLLGESHVATKGQQRVGETF